jgi:hypothetical protein
MFKHNTITNVFAFKDTQFLYLTKEKCFNPKLNYIAPSSKGRCFGRGAVVRNPGLLGRVFAMNRSRLRFYGKFNRLMKKLRSSICENRKKVHFYIAFLEFPKCLKKISRRMYSWIHLWLVTLHTNSCTKSTIIFQLYICCFSQFTDYA